MSTILQKNLAKGIKCPSCGWDRNMEKAKCCFLCLTKLDDGNYKLDKIEGEWVYVKKKNANN